MKYQAQIRFTKAGAETTVNAQIDNDSIQCEEQAKELFKMKTAREEGLTESEIEIVKIERL